MVRLIYAVVPSLVLLLTFCLMFPPAVSLAINHPTSNPYETRPSADGYLQYLIQPVPAGVTIETRRDGGYARRREAGVQRLPS